MNKRKPYRTPVFKKKTAYLHKLFCYRRNFYNTARLILKSDAITTAPVPDILLQIRQFRTEVRNVSALNIHHTLKNFNILFHQHSLNCEKKSN